VATATATKAAAATKGTEGGTEAGIGAKELAAKLGTDGRTLRKFLRAQGIGVGFGNRYSWPSLADPQVKRITKLWNEAGEAAE